MKLCEEGEWTTLIISARVYFDSADFRWFPRSAGVPTAGFLKLVCHCTHVGRFCKPRRLLRSNIERPSRSLRVFIKCLFGRSVPRP